MFTNKKIRGICLLLIVILLLNINKLSIRGGSRSELRELGLLVTHPPFDPDKKEREEREFRTSLLIWSGGFVCIVLVLGIVSGWSNKEEFRVKSEDGTINLGYGDGWDKDYRTRDIDWDTLKKRHSLLPQPSSQLSQKATLKETLDWNRKYRGMSPFLPHPNKLD